MVCRIVFLISNMGYRFRLVIQFQAKAGFLKVENVLQEIFLLFMRITIPLRMAFVVVIVVFHLRTGRRPHFSLSRSFKDFVKFTAIEPDATAFGAVIDFYAGAVSDIQGYVADRTVHDS